MKAAGGFIFRAILVMALVILVAALFLVVEGRLTARNLSDFLFYASFLTLTVGAMAGLFNVGIKQPGKGGSSAARDLRQDGDMQNGRLAHSMRDILRVETLGWFIIVVGALVLLSSIAIDKLF
jgi:hypothetical protein